MPSELRASLAMAKVFFGVTEKAVPGMSIRKIEPSREKYTLVPITRFPCCPFHNGCKGGDTRNH